MVVRAGRESDHHDEGEGVGRVSSLVIRRGGRGRVQPDAATGRLGLAMSQCLLAPITACQLVRVSHSPPLLATPQQHAPATQPQASARSRHPSRRCTMARRARRCDSSTWRTRPHCNRCTLASHSTTALTSSAPRTTPQQHAPAAQQQAAPRRPCGASASPTPPPLFTLTHPHLPLPLPASTVIGAINPRTQSAQQQA